MLMHSLTNLSSSMPDKTVSPIPTRYILDDIAEPVGLVSCSVCKLLCSSNSHRLPPHLKVECLQVEHSYSSLGYSLWMSHVSWDLVSLIVPP